MQAPVLSLWHRRGKWCPDRLGNLPEVGNLPKVTQRQSGWNLRFGSRAEHLATRPHCPLHGKVVVYDDWILEKPLQGRWVEAVPNLMDRFQRVSDLFRATADRCWKPMPGMDLSPVNQGPCPQFQPASSALGLKEGSLLGVDCGVGG